jgi:hypothetical protein
MAPMMVRRPMPATMPGGLQRHRQIGERAAEQQIDRRLMVARC